MSIFLSLQSTVLYLTGKTYSTTEVDEEFRELAAGASLVLDRMNKIRSSNFLARTDKPYTPNTLKKAIEESNLARKRLNKFRENEEFDPGKINHKFTRLTNEILDNQIGNCGELSLVFIRLIKEIFPTLKVELADYTYGDHVFVVLNRGPKGELKKSLIIDPWTRTIQKGKIKNLPLDHIGKVYLFDDQGRATSCPVVRRYERAKIEFTEYSSAN